MNNTARPIKRPAGRDGKRQSTLSGFISLKKPKIGTVLGSGVGSGAISAGGSVSNRKSYISFSKPNHNSKNSINNGQINSNNSRASSLVDELYKSTNSFGSNSGSANGKNVNNGASIETLIEVVDSHGSSSSTDVDSDGISIISERNVVPLLKLLGGGGRSMRPNQSLLETKAQSFDESRHSHNYVNNTTSISKTTTDEIFKMQTTSNSLTTEKSVKMFQKLENLAGQHRPRLAASSSLLSAQQSMKYKNNYSSNTTTAFGPTGVEEIKFSEEQIKVLDLIVKQEKSVFFTGSAGTGKSVLLREVIKRLLDKYNNREDLVAVTASTGLAAVNIGGQTLHRFAGIGIGKGSAEELMKRVAKNENNVRRWRVAKVLIIDEISMIDGDLFTKLSKIAQFIRKSSTPFGGLQVVLTGDFFQLPPVPDKYLKKQPLYCFQSPEWNKSIERTILLTKVFRQKGDNVLINMLNTVRLGNCTSEVTQKFVLLSREVHYADNILPTELFPTRNEVHQSNSTRLNKLPGRSWTFKAKDVFTSDFPNVIEQEKKLLGNVLASENLVLKEDAQVLMLHNMDDKIVNGSIGIVLFFLPETIFTQIINEYGEDYLAEPEALKEIRFVSQCVGLENFEEGNIKQKFSEFDQGSRKRMRRFIIEAMKSSMSLALPVVSFSIPNEPQRRIRLIQKEEFSVAYAKGKRVVRIQVPLLLSWALSIHKSQGQTLDRVKVDLAKIFEKGQVYVALSRATSKDRLQVLNFSPSKIRASQQVIEFYRSLERVDE